MLERLSASISSAGCLDTKRWEVSQPMQAGLKKLSMHLFVVGLVAVAPPGMKVHCCIRRLLLWVISHSPAATHQPPCRRIAQDTTSADTRTLSALKTCQTPSLLSQDLLHSELGADACTRKQQTFKSSCARGVNTAMCHKGSHRQSGADLQKGQTVVFVKTSSARAMSEWRALEAC